MLTIHTIAAEFYEGYEDESTKEQIGVKDSKLLLSALFEMQQTYGKEELYPTIFLKAACLIRSVIQNHPFYNANKRTAVLAMIIFLEANNYEVKVKDNQLLHFARGIAINKPSVSRIARTIKKWCIYVPPQNKPSWKRILGLIASITKP